MNRFLVFDLFGPMAGWGDIAVGEVRDSSTHPSRSAIIGLLMGAMGAKRSEHDMLEALADGLSVSIVERHRGRSFVDYQTVETPEGKKATGFATRRDELRYPKRGTMQTYRTYLTDVWYQVLLARRVENDATPTLSELQEALMQPGFAPYLGRRSCPAALPMRPRIVEAESVAEALMIGCSESTAFLQKLAIPGLEEAMLGPAEVRAFSDRSFGTVEHTVERRDEPASRARWTFEPRTEFRTTLRLVEGV